MNALRDRIQSTLDANADTRRQAELDLKYVCLCLIRFICLYILLIIISGYRLRRNPGSQALCWIFCRENKTMLFNFLVWRNPAILVLESLVYTITFNIFATMRINRKMISAICCQSQFFHLCANSFHSRCVPEKPHQPRMGPLRRHQQLQKDPRRRASSTPRSINSHSRRIPAQRSCAVHTAHYQDPLI